MYLPLSMKVVDLWTLNIMAKIAKRDINYAIIIYFENLTYSWGYVKKAEGWGS